MRHWQTRHGLTITRVLSGRNNVYLVSNGDQALLVDTATANRWTALKQQLNRLNITPENLSGLVLTHAHFDHAANAARVQARYQVPVIIHASEAELLSRGENTTIRGAVWYTRLIVRAAGEKGLARLNYMPTRADIWVNGHYNLNALGFDAYLLETPGHSPGSISCIVDNQFALVGDAMVGALCGSILPVYSADVRQLVQSWQVLLDTGCEWFLPGHRPPHQRAVIEKEIQKYTALLNEGKYP